ncbi:MAG: glycoside hydrolase family 99-like domain-containing protein [Nevskia sp.]|nr:glycoside hydrolase family 99-like domain-containing protein [Nevskia sp.]
MNFRQQLLANLEQNPAYQEHAPAACPIDARPVRLIAFYLPQFHPIPQNDLWWGKGFTEWTNVTRAIPRFVGHYQPHLPGELGFYDLRLPDTLRRQAALARHYGVGGFCFHYYWFNGQRILETPLANLLAHPDIDLPFCINWANENWTRTWDGREQEALLEQAHSEADDIAFARALEPVLRDPRYIRIRGRPLVMLYRPGLLPDAAATLRRWRAHFTAAGLGDPFLVMAQGFGDTNPRRYGFDAAAEFPPHKVGWKGPDLATSVRRFAPDYAGRVLSYDRMVRTAMGVEDADFTLFRGVCPAWDNEARRPNQGVTLVNATPAKYGEWLAWACRRALRAKPAEERIVFINAWNEWAEGAHLEPDQHFGYAWLRETANALAALASPRPACPVIGTEATDLLPAQMNVLARIKAPLRRLLRAGR